MKLRERIISLVLSLTILTNMVGCSNSNDKKEQNDNSKDYGHEIVIDKIDFGKLPDSDIDITKFLNKLNELSLNFKHSDYGYTEKEIASILEITDTMRECENDDDLLLYDIYASIINNSNNHANSPFKNDEASKIFRKSLAYVLDSLEKDLSDEDLCKLNNLSIVFEEDYNSLSYYINKENKIIINFDVFKDLKDNFGDYYLYEDDTKTFQDHLTKVLQHRINQARQNSCSCRIDSGQTNSALYHYGLSTFLEASSESQIYSESLNEDELDSLDNYNYHYQIERSSQSYLLLMGLFKPTFSLEKYYDAIYSSDLKAFHELFGLDKEEDYLSFYNIVYLLETQSYRTNLASSLTSDGYNYEKFKEGIGTTYRIQIFKEVIKDLIQRVSVGDITLEESLYLYNYVKLYVIDGVANIIDDEGNFMEDEDGHLIYEYSDEFLEGIKYVENVFYDFVKSAYDISDDYISSWNEQRESILRALLSYNYLSDMGEHYSIEEKELINKILEKFPTIKEISFSNRLYIYGLENFEEIILKRSVN